MDYAGWIKAVCDILEYPVVDATTATPTGTAFDTMIASTIDYTENRIQRDLDLLGTIVTDASPTMTANTRKQTLPAVNGGIFVVASQIRLIVAGVRQPPLEAVSRDFLDYAWPDENSLGASILPQQWAPNDQVSVLVGPAPATTQAYEIVGTARVAQLSNTNTSNFLTQRMPDLYVAASMIFLSGYQRDFGAQADDPKMALSWESTYQTLKASATVEEARKRFADMSVSPSNPNTLQAAG